MTLVGKFVKSLRLSIKNIDLKDMRAKSAGFERQKIVYPARIMVRPFDSFSDIKYENKGSMMIAGVLLFLFFFAGVLQFFYTGYIFNDNKVARFNIFLQLLYSVVPVLLWCISNWSVCTLMDGEGKLGHIFIVTCYALTPRIFGIFINIFLSRFLTIQESMFIAIVDQVSLLFMALLVLAGMLVIHNYTLMRAIASSVLTIVGIMAIIFLCIIFFGVVQQIYGFVQTIYMEMLNR